MDTTDYNFEEKWKKLEESSKEVSGTIGAVTGALVGASVAGLSAPVFYLKKGLLVKKRPMRYGKLVPKPWKRPSG